MSFSIMTADLFISLSNSIKYIHTHIQRERERERESMLLRAYKLKIQRSPKIQKENVD